MSFYIIRYFNYVGTSTLFHPRLVISCLLRMLLPYLSQQIFSCPPFLRQLHRRQKWAISFSVESRSRIIRQRSLMTKVTYQFCMKQQDPDTMRCAPGHRSIVSILVQWVHVWTRKPRYDSCTKCMLLDKWGKSQTSLGLKLFLCKVMKQNILIP